MQGVSFNFLVKHTDIQNFYIQPIRNHQNDMFGHPKPMYLSWKTYFQMKNKPKANIWEWENHNIKGLQLALLPGLYNLGLYIK